MLFGVVNQLYQQTSIIMTSNKGVSEWGEFMGDPVITTAILNRLMLKSFILGWKDMLLSKKVRGISLRSIKKITLIIRVIMGLI